MQNSEDIKKETFLWAIFEQVRRRGFSVGLDDYLLLWQTLRAGFGWSSPIDLCNLCCSLWAKSQQEQNILTTLFKQIEGKPLFDWQLPLISPLNTSSPTHLDKTPPTDSTTNSLHNDVNHSSDPPSVEPNIDIDIPNTVTTNEYPHLPDVSFKEVNIPERPFVFIPQYPLNYREIVQTWRRLRHPIREGPKVELDINATIASRVKKGTAVPIELMAKRRNNAALLLLIDSQGSMLPFHNFIEEFCKAIEQAGRFQNFAKYYFHNLLSEGADETILSQLPKTFITNLDPIIHLIEANEKGYIYQDSNQIKPLALADILKKDALKTHVVIVSDAGAARKTFDIKRLLNTIAFLKALSTYTKQYVWLNPCPKDYWTKTTAGEIARHTLMFPLNHDGIYNAVNALRGQIYPVERPI